MTAATTMSASFVARITVPLAAAATVLAVDQATKALMVDVLMQPVRVIAMTPFLNLTLVYNRGISFGLFGDLLSGAPFILSVVLLAVTGGIMWTATRCRSRLDQLALGAIAGGAFGNALDRMRRGGVTDFLDLHVNSWHWPAFNLADVAICLGAALFAARAFAPPIDNPSKDDRVGEI